MIKYVSVHLPIFHTFLGACRVDKLETSAICRTKKRSHAGVLERSDSPGAQSTEGKGLSWVQHREEGQGCSLGREIVSDSKKKDIYLFV